MTNKNSEENNEYYIPNSIVDYWSGGLYFTPDKKIPCPVHSPYTRLFIFEREFNQRSERKSLPAQWCIKCIERYYLKLPLMIEQFFKDHPDLALEI
ncbi:MAG TPA: hypothetical protein VNX68_04470 [Nitrosopumilaceae archaeon]|jgi:hypothetical protein|nr:hypothetical protein [Nitrosopumilaceae archaeon]